MRFDGFDVFFDVFFDVGLDVFFDVGLDVGLDAGLDDVEPRDAIKRSSPAPRGLRLL